MSPVRTRLLAAALLTGAVGAAAADPATTAGVWQKHEVQFHYQGFTSVYSCDGLASKLKALLLAAGARADARSVPGACSSLSGRPDRFASARLEFHTLAPPPAGDAGDAQPRSAQAGPGQEIVPGQWRKVALADGRPLSLGLGGGDCELLEQFRDAVLAKAFTTRNRVDHLRCVPHQVNSGFSLEFETLAAPPDRASKPAG